jgi:allantoinase
MSVARVEHSYYDRTPISARKPFRWPDGAAVAFAIVTCLETYEVAPPEGAFLPPNVPGGFGRAPYPDVRAFSQREYGHRVGIFRIIDALDKYKLKATAAIDARTAEACPSLVKDILDLNWDIAGHGHAVTQVISSHMTPVTERGYVQSALSAVSRATRTDIKGWHGPEYGESLRTPAILAECGLKYVLDWPNDEQPYRMRTDNGPLLSVPLAIDFDDVFAHWQRKISMERWVRSIKDALDQLEIDGRSNGRMLVLNLHPWLIGQPWRVTFLYQVLKDLVSRKSVWLTTTNQIAHWAEGQLP